MARHVWNTEPQCVYSDSREFRKDFDKIHWHARSSSLNHKCLFGIFCTFDLWHLCSLASFFRFFDDYERDEDGNYVVNSAGNVWDYHDHGEVSRWSYWSSLSWDDQSKTPRSSRSSSRLWWSELLIKFEGRSAFKSGQVGRPTCLFHLSITHSLSANSLSTFTHCTFTECKWQIQKCYIEYRF